MIGVFDTGIGGLTVLRALVDRFPAQRFAYLGDHANMPYGERPSREIVDLTRNGVVQLFALSCRLVVLGCNTATAIAARELQQNWLPRSTFYDRHNLLGIVAPTVEAATQTPWAVTTPQYPQKFNTDAIVVFGTPLTVRSNVYVEEIAKRCPKVAVHQQACPGLAHAIEEATGAEHLTELVARACESCLVTLAGRVPERAILGCTHYPIVEELFAAHLPAATRILSQPRVVADSLDDYLERHPQYRSFDRDIGADTGTIRLLTTGDADTVTRIARRMWPDVGTFATAA